jgi:hypothetical protein
MGNLVRRRIVNSREILARTAKTKLQNSGIYR